MKILGIIPARFASSRFPGKPLADIGGKSMIERVYWQAKKSPELHDVVVATDDARIVDHVLGFNGKVCMTADSHASGTDRCFEVLSYQKEEYDYVMNIQGDEPFISPDQISLLANLLDGKVQIATLVKRLKDNESLVNPNVVKAILNSKSEAIYFSRSPLPHLRNVDSKDWSSNYSYFKHIGLYAYRIDILEVITKLSVSNLEKAESLEQLRWIENGIPITVTETHLETIAIDTPDDLQRALKEMK